MTVRSSTDHTIGSTFGGLDRNIINEPGLYSLVMGSRKPDAKAVKKRVESEVLPSIRKTRSYGNASQAGFPLVKIHLGIP